MKSDRERVGSWRCHGPLQGHCSCDSESGKCPAARPDSPRRHELWVDSEPRAIYSYPSMKFNLPKHCWSPWKMHEDSWPRTPLDRAYIKVIFTPLGWKFTRGAAIKSKENYKNWCRTHIFRKMLKVWPQKIKFQVRGDSLMDVLPDTVCRY